MRLRHSASILAMSICAGLSHAQTQRIQNPEIHGVVLDPGTKQPVVDAEVSLYFLSEERPTVRSGIGSLTPSSQVQTDATGAFVFHPDKLGYYTVAARKEGYTTPDRTEGRNILDVTLTGAEPAGEALLALSRPGQITAVVVDEDTGKPIPNVAVIPGKLARNFGRLTVAGSPVKTDVDGRFIASNIPSGEYIVMVPPQRSGKERILSGFSEGDLKTVDEDYDRTYWPGGASLEAAVPIMVATGASVDFGKVRARKAPYYRLHVRIPPGSCAEGDAVLIYEQVPFISTTIGRAPCAPDLLIAGFRPGGYRLQLTIIGRDAARHQTASIPFVIKDENVEIVAPLERGVTVNVTVGAADGAKAPDLSRLRVSFHPLNALPVAHILMPKDVDASGKAQFVGIPLGDEDVIVEGVPPGNYVKEIRYNGDAVRDGIVPLGAAMAQDLQIVIDDKPAAITGTVMAGDRPVSNALLVLSRWPLTNHMYRSNWMSTALSDSKGTFQFVDLAPGEYRLLALRSKEEFDARMPQTLERALETAKKIEAGPRAVQNVALEPIALR